MKKSMNSKGAADLTWLAPFLFTLVFLIATWPSGVQAQVPEQSKQYLPVLVKAVGGIWPELSIPEYLAGQVEQETCASLKSSKCWNPRTENINPKNDGEYGWGLGQLTNTNRYNNFKDVTTKYAGLKAWKWEDRFNPEYQLKTMAYMDRTCAKPYLGETSESVSLQFALSCYNGGQGSVLKDRAYCAQVSGCDKNVWFGNVETHSLKARTKLSGYSVSAFDINRDYVRNIWTLRGPRYKEVVRQIKATAD